MDAGQQTALQRIVDGLLNLEIDTIVKPGMTGRKMPVPPQALIDIIGSYDTYICQSATDLNAAWDRHGRPTIRVRPPAPPDQSPNRQADSEGTINWPLAVEPALNVVNEDSFDGLRERAVEAEAVYRYLVGRIWFPDDDRGVVLTRIYRNCDQIKAMLSSPELKSAVGNGVGRDQARDAKLPLSSADLITLRKVWEIGVETVIMQTVVQLDGDVVTRIQQGWETAQNKPIHDMHQDAVGNSTQQWQFLAQTVTQFLSSALKDFFLQ
jgi:hypothetical protein